MLRLFPRSSVLRSARFGRCSSSSAPNQSPKAVETSTTAPNAIPEDFDLDISPASSSHLAVPTPSNFTITSGLELDSDEKTMATRKQRPSTPNLSLHDKCQTLRKWTWFDVSSDSHQRLKSISKSLKTGTELRAVDFEWFSEQYELAKSFRQARSRLWYPSGMTEDDMMKLVKAKNVGYQNTSNQTEYEALLDSALIDSWISLSEKERKEALLRVRYDCARRLGWRKGYSSGFPLRSKGGEGEEVDSEREARADVLKRLSSTKSSAQRKATRELLAEEEESGWKEWKRMSNQTRAEEEKTMWTLRDRSMIYVDDSTSTILGATAPRWYHQPQKIGDMSFLPNDVVRFVRNNTVRNGKYDAFKATFRIPLSMHKHGLRSYLLAIYGLRTTWCRSTIYRASVRRSRFGQWNVGPARRTFKKVEVGLVEPFVFPEISQSFLTKELMQDEMKHEQGRLYMRISGRRRVRSGAGLNHGTFKKIKVDTSEASIEDGEFTTRFDGKSYTTIQHRGDLEEKKEMPFSIWGGNSRSMKKSSILKRVHALRVEKERQVTERVKELKVGSVDQRAS
ncbi:hypothetical protein CBS101457_001992 [Exobasidium rhododendri]|nr:hypothetical protein CBS101457_001992 [Exobasidium rhododendri]